MIKINNLNKYYFKGKSNQIHVIDNTSLELPSKGLITFLGHSGSGKTTLLNVIGGLDKAHGEIDYDGEKFYNYQRGKIDKFRSRNIGYVFQNYNLLLEETVYDNLRIALDLIGITDIEEQQKRISYSLKAVGMYKYRKKVASFLSGGQQQRVSIARALVKRCKIIIADEPTGNLDSKNTVEVMNILKKISEHSLVLLVTHEENVANFYSDYIYEIKDGKVINQREIEDNVTLKDTDDSVIYLKDLNENSYNTEVGNLNFYSDNEEKININFDVVIKDGSIYLRSDKPIKLVEQSNIKLINDHYKEKTKEDITSFDYDISWYNDDKEDKDVLRKFFKRLKNSFISFRAVGKKQTFIYVCLGLIGCITAIGFSLLSNAVAFDLSNLPHSDKIYTIEIGKDSNKTTIEALSQAYKKNYIDDLYQYENANVTYEEKITLVYAFSYSQPVAAFPYFDYSVNLVCGEGTSDINDIVISENIAKEICKGTHRTNEQLIGRKISLDSGEFVIKGISNSDYSMVFYSKEYYELKALNKFRNYGYYDNFNTYIIDGNRFEDSRIIKSKKYENYTIVKGRDIEKPNEVIIDQENRYSVGQTVYLDSVAYEVVGIFEDNEKDGSDYGKYIIDKDIIYLYNRGTVGIFDGSKNVELVEGRYPKEDSEVIVSVYHKHLVDNNKISINGRSYQVVGTFAGNDSMENYYLINSNQNFLKSIYYESNVGFKVVDKDKVDEFFIDDDCYILSITDKAIRVQKELKQNLIKAFFIIFVVTAIGTSIFVYFTMRSKMISDIYSIGVYRSLGASCGRINRKYMSDIFVLTIFTSLIGYILGVLGYAGICSMFNEIIRSVLYMSVLVFDWGVIMLGVLALFVIMMTFGMIPIILLGRKTPSEIIAKYDI